MSNLLHDQNFVVAVLAVLTATVTAIVSAITTTHKIWVKILLLMVALLAMTLGFVSSYYQYEGKISAQKDFKGLQDKLNIINLDTADLGVLSRMGAKDKKYFVRLDAGPDSDLEKTKDKIEGQFGIRKDSTDLIVADAALDPTVKESCILIWGHDLSLAAAAVIKQLADGHSLSNGKAVIRVQKTFPLKTAGCKTAPAGAH